MLRISPAVREGKKKCKVRSLEWLVELDCGGRMEDDGHAGRERGLVGGGDAQPGQRQVAVNGNQLRERARPFLPHALKDLKSIHIRLVFFWYVCGLQLE